MSQNDMSIANAVGATVRADINSALQALASSSKGPSAPGTPYAGQFWLDDDTPSATVWTLSLYDGTDWISVGTFDSTANTFSATNGVKTNVAPSFTVAINEAATVDVASASTTDIGAAASNNVRVTGTTTITGLGTAAAGITRTVRFAGALVLTYHASSLILPTAASITTAANDCANFLSLGSGSWLCRWYQRADGTALSSSGSGSVDAGTIVMTARATAPTGWVLCYGQAISRATFAGLFSAIGTAYGSGDGSTTFNVPDLRGRVGVGKDDMGGSAANRMTASATGGLDGDTLGNTGGEQAHQLTEAELAAHDHPIPVFTGGISTGPLRTNTGNSAAPFNSSNAGGDQAHNNVQPSIVVNYIIKT